MVPNLGGSPQVVLIQPKLKIGKLKILRKTCRILVTSASDIFFVTDKNVTT